MRYAPTSTESGAPSSPPSTEKTCYQSRVGVSPTSTPNLGFAKTAAGGMPGRYPGGHVMGYTPINGREPNAIEKGTGQPSQKNKGG